MGRGRDISLRLDQGGHARGVLRLQHVDEGLVGISVRVALLRLA